MEKITSRRNPVCVHLRKLGMSREYRNEQRQYLCDGTKLLGEAIMNGAKITAVISSSYPPFPVPEETPLYHAGKELIDSISPLKNAQETIFACSMNEAEDCDFTEGTHILLDGVQDPGNVGTIIRSAHAFGIKSVILTGDCADVYNPKTIRATMGAIFKQKVFRISTSGLADLKRNGTSFTGAAQGEDAVLLTGINIKDTIIAVGNEGAGLSDDVLALCGSTVYIPVSVGCESLNAAVAASVIMWECVRKD